MEHTNEETGEVLHDGVISADNPLALVPAISAVMGEISEVPKSGRNEHYNYDYATESDVTRTLRPLLAEQGLALWVSVVSTESEMVQVSSGEARHWIVTLDVTLANEEGYVTTRWRGESIDTGDKGVNKAYTAAIKYWALKTFLISSGDDDSEQDSYEYTGKKEKGGYDPLGLDDEMPFGKHKGNPVRWIVDNHVDYLVWLAGEKEDFELTEEARNYANQVVQSQQEKVRDLQNQIDEAQND